MCLCPPGYSGRYCDSLMGEQRKSNKINNMINDMGMEGGFGPSSTSKNFYRFVSANNIHNNDGIGMSGVSKYDSPLPRRKSHHHSSGGRPLQSSILPPKNPCLTEKCKNNGTCVMSFSHAKNSFSFVCKCATGFFGPLCENVTKVAELVNIPTGLNQIDEKSTSSTSTAGVNKPHKNSKDAVWLGKNNRRIKPG